MSDHDDLVERLLLVEDGVWRNPEGEEAAKAIIALRGERDRLRAEYERAILQQLELRKAAEARVRELENLCNSLEAEASGYAHDKKAAEEQLGELLAIIHRDGGHYQEAHGTEKAVNDAHQIWAELMSKAEEAALANPAVPERSWQPIETAPKNEEILIAYWRWRNSMSPGSVVVQSAQMTEFHGEGIWSWVVSDNKHGPFPIRGWSDGDILGWMPLPKPPVAAAEKEARG